MVHVDSVEETAVRGSRKHALLLQDPQETAAICVDIHCYTSSLEEGRRGEGGGGGGGGGGVRWDIMQRML